MVKIIFIGIYLLRSQYYHLLLKIVIRAEFKYIFKRCFLCTTENTNFLKRNTITLAVFVYYRLPVT